MPSHTDTHCSWPWHRDYGPFSTMDSVGPALEPWTARGPLWHHSQCTESRLVLFRHTLCCFKSPSVIWPAVEQQIGHWLIYDATPNQTFITMCNLCSWNTSSSQVVIVPTTKAEECRRYELEDSATIVCGAPVVSLAYCHCAMADTANASLSQKQLRLFVKCYSQTEGSCGGCNCAAQPSKLAASSDGLLWSWSSFKSSTQLTKRLFSLGMTRKLCISASDSNTLMLSRVTLHFIYLTSIFIWSNERLREHGQPVPGATGD